jgi:hypothetical protein
MLLRFNDKFEFTPALRARLGVAVEKSRERKEEETILFVVQG